MGVRGGNAPGRQESDTDAEDDEAALRSMATWEPDPVDADPRRSSRARRLHDSIALLVGIYGSKALFIQEYRWLIIRCCDPLLDCTLVFGHPCDIDVRAA